MQQNGHMRTSAVLAALVSAGLLAVAGAVYLAPAPVSIPQATDLTASLPTPARTRPATLGHLDGAHGSEPAEVEIVEPVLPVLKLARTVPDTVATTTEPASRQVTAATGTAPGESTGDAGTRRPAPSDGPSGGDHSSGKDG